MTQPQHSPTPWEVKHWKYEGNVWSKTVISNSDTAIGELFDVFREEDNELLSESESEKQANAAFIVRACNSYDEMLAFIEKVAAWDFEGIGLDKLENMQAEAFDLIRKVRV